MTKVDCRGDIMTEKNKITVSIMGENYTIVSEESKEFVVKVADYVDQKMRVFSGSNSLLSYQKVAVLTALNIADDYHKLLDQSGLDAPEVDDSYLDTRAKLANLTMQLEQSSTKYKNMSQQFEKLLDNSASYESELASLKNKLDLLSEELENKDQQLIAKDERVKHLEKMVDDLLGDIERESN